MIFDFICPGAPKTASSFLYALLRIHPQIRMGPKDIVYLNENGSHDWEKYLQNHIKNEFLKFKLGHFDVSLCANKEWLKRTPKYLKRHGKVLFCTRCPVDRALSEWRMRLLQFDDAGCPRENLDFLSALTQSKSRKKSPLDYYLYNAYIENGNYEQHLETLLNSLSSSQLKIIKFDDLTGYGLLSKLKEIEEFLGLSSFFSETLIGSTAKSAQMESKTSLEVSFKFHLNNGDKVNYLNSDRLHECKSFDVFDSHLKRKTFHEIKTTPWQGLATYPKKVNENLRFSISQEDRLNLLYKHWARQSG